ncbi:DgyrCDS11840 [Dimorphilus gyrociliatus]|uniref:DgyrCDS11840 n=1 Tax=Dimorphilus gyrociliatus TaxID=2664684 RepID=A0A7I8W4T6_9ANNE|nr:DgyrCDS11840 [Dimorphilus gyrociliatus]
MVTFYVLVLAATIATATLGNEVINPVIPVPRRRPGVILSENTLAKKVLVDFEVFLELNCPDSKVTWPVLKRVAQDFAPKGVRLTVNQFALPYHQYGYLSTLAYYFINNNNASLTVPYADAIFENIREFGLRSWTKTPIEMTKRLSEIAVSVGYEQGFNTTDILAFSGPVRTTWKYATRRLYTIKRIIDY